MISSLSFELLKLRKRPATWVIGLVFLFVVVAFFYLANYFSIEAARQVCERRNLPNCGGAFDSLYPRNLVGTVLTAFGNMGTALALILGSLSAGNEYGEGTLKTVLTQGPGRLAYLSGKLLGIAVVLAVFTVVVFLAGAASSYVVAVLQGAPGSLQGPPAGEVLEGLGAGWLILACFGSLGFFLAVLFRGAAAAIGVGLAYLVAAEGLIASLPQQGFVETVSGALPGRNATGLASAVGGVRQSAGPGLGQLTEPSHPGFALAAYGVAAVLLAMLLFRRRDVT